MRRMAILLAAVVAVFAIVVVVVLPPIFGGVARSFLADFNRGIPIGGAFGTDLELGVAFEDWDAGWFSSTATVQLKAGWGPASLASSAFAGDRIVSETPVVVTLRHGPMLSGTPSGLGWASLQVIVDQDMFEIPGVEAEARLGLLLGFAGGARVGVDVPDIRVGEPKLDGGQRLLHFGGLEAVADWAGDTIDLDAEFRGLRWIDERGYDNSRGEVGQITLTARVHRDPRMPVLWLGDLGFDGAGFAALIGDQPSVELGRFRFGIGTGIVDGIFDARIQGEVSDALLPFGPAQLRLDNLTADASARYGARSLARLIGLIDGVDTSGQGIGQLFALMGVADALINERLLVGVRRLSVTHEGRTASAALTVEYRGDEMPSYYNLEKFVQVIDNPSRLPIRAALNLAFHQDLVRGLVRSVVSGTEADSYQVRSLAEDARELDAAMRDLARFGVLEERGDQYTMRAEFDNGELRLNGQSLNGLVRALGGQRSDTAQMLRALADGLARR